MKHRLITLFWIFSVVVMALCIPKDYHAHGWGLDVGLDITVGLFGMLQIVSRKETA
jgi:hypothetical protein